MAILNIQFYWFYHNFSWRYLTGLLGKEAYKSTGYMRCGGPWSQSLDKILTNRCYLQKTFLFLSPNTSILALSLFFCCVFFYFFFCHISSSFISNNHFCDYEMLFNGVCPVFKLLHTFIWSLLLIFFAISLYFSLYGPNHLPYIHSSLYQLI